MARCASRSLARLRASCDGVSVETLRVPVWRCLLESWLLAKVLPACRDMLVPWPYIPFRLLGLVESQSLDDMALLLLLLLLALVFVLLMVEAGL